MRLNPFPLPDELYRQEILPIRQNSYTVPLLHFRKTLLRLRQARFLLLIKYNPFAVSFPLIKVYQNLPITALEITIR